MVMVASMMVVMLSDVGGGSISEKSQDASRDERIHETSAEEKPRLHAVSRLDHVIL